MQKLLVFFTDGRNTNKRHSLLPYAKSIQELGVRSIAVGVGKKVDRKELENIASSARNVFMVNSFEDLGTVIEVLTPVSCQGALRSSPLKI